MPLAHPALPIPRAQSLGSVLSTHPILRAAGYKGAKIQLLDLPGIIEGAKDGKGRGKRVIGTARTCSLILVVLDASKPVTHKKLLEKELHGISGQ